MQQEQEPVDNGNSLNNITINLLRKSWNKTLLLESDRAEMDGGTK